MSSGTIPQNVRFASPRGENGKNLRKKGAGVKREPRRNRSQNLVSNASAIIPKVIRIVLGEDAESWKYDPTQGNIKPLAKRQLVDIIVRKGVVDAKRVRTVSQRREVARLAAKLIIDEGLLETAPWSDEMLEMTVGVAAMCEPLDELSRSQSPRRSYVVLSLGEFGVLFLEGMSLAEIRRLRSQMLKRAKAHHPAARKRALSVVKTGASA